ncbi:AAA family ATPase [Cohnella ginsengisoli]|uniref:AAA family ATPase n=1 Tax=Cohnella ginsengisoli TaxID=425004 RepID=A0A9X4QKR6_9BACL|nr:AAA family ATPase [Cohnella ginsengisoli]MDG0789948.1 AAA family ATPase [Cohnella ginsengisoli]
MFKALFWLGSPLLVCTLMSLLAKGLKSEGYLVLQGTWKWALIYYLVVGLITRAKKNIPKVNLSAIIGAILSIWAVILINAWGLKLVPASLVQSDIALYPWTYDALKRYLFGWQAVFVLAGAVVFHVIGLHRRPAEKEAVSADKRSLDREEILEAALDKLDQMIGLEEVKAEIKGFMNQLVGLAKLAKVAVVSKPTLHMIFSGPPGTGKTEVARIMADILYGLGFLETNTLIECDRSQIIGKYVGHTEEKMNGLIEHAMGGVLFIDEAYTLSKEGNDFGQEAVDILLKAMEDKRDRFMVILAGYQADMNALLEMNEGFKSRIPYHLKFRDYGPNELADLAEMMLNLQGYETVRATEILREVIWTKHRRGEISGNGRWVRHLVDRILKEHAISIASDDREAGVITSEDIRKAAGMNRSRYETENEQLKKEALLQLDQLIGLDNIKSEIKDFLSFVEAEKEREASGISSQKMSMHMAFTGPPGTGKTTVARILGKLLKAAGMLSTGQFIEADRSQIIGKFVGHTEDNMKKLLDQADGGVLFIDEAYSLVKEGNDFGSEAIAVLIKAMEDRRDNLVVILAGYENEMKELMRSNSGIPSRIPFTFRFPSYSASEMSQIVRSILAEHQLELSLHASHVLDNLLISIRTFNGNARWGRDFVGKIRMAQVRRIKQSGMAVSQEITEQDIIEAIAKTG